LLPPFVAQQQSYTGTNNGTGLVRGIFDVATADPPGCTVGFLPPSSYRSPADTSDIDTPEDLYCKLPQDSPIAVRGARNYPCMDKPGKRAPTVEICKSDKPFEPLAMRQHVLGPNPLDPNLLSQGVPIDDRVSLGDNLYAPAEGTPLPPGVLPSGTPPAAPQTPLPPGAPPSTPPVPLAPPVAPVDATAQVPPVPSEPTPPPTAVPHGSGGVPAAAPNSFGDSGSGVGPTAAVAEYNPRTGEYVGEDGRLYRQSSLTAPAQSWQDMLPR